MEADGLSETDDRFIDKLYDDIDKGKVCRSVFYILNKNAQIY